MKRATEDELFAATFRPMRRKVSFGSKVKRAIEDERFAPRFRQMWRKMDRRRKKSAPKLQLHSLNREEEKGGEKDKENTEEEKLVLEEEDRELEEEDDHDTPTIDKETHRLAAVNMDWDHIKAVDLYMFMTSRIPEGGRVLSVSIYPSEFGLKCMYIEKTLGHSTLIGADDSEEDADLVSETDSNKLRTYELNRLGYYYAVVVCDSSATALHLYTTLDGTEFLKTANVFDLQFVPDCRGFHYPARDVATEAPPSYKEPDFETRVLQHSKVNPTWDDDALERKVLRRKLECQLDQFLKFVAKYESVSYEDSADDFFDDEEVKPMKKEKAKDKPREEHYEAEASKEELELLAAAAAAAGQDAATNAAKGYNIMKRKSKKDKDHVEDKLDVSKDADPQYKRIVRKQAGKKASKNVGSLKRCSKKAKQE